jgi:hypothetical protein
MIIHFSNKQFDLDSRNLFFTTALSFEREATRVARELRINLNSSVARIVNS